MKKLALTYRQGTWFRVPLRTGRFATGLVARVSRDEGVVLGYFFAPAIEQTPELEQLVRNRPADARLVCRFGGLSLQDGSWPIIGHDPQFRCASWPMVAFARRDDLAKVAFKVEYDESDPNVVVSERKLSYEEARTLNPDRMCGAGAVERILTQLLAGPGAGLDS